MKKQISFIVAGLFFFLHSYSTEPVWININSKSPAPSKISVVSSTINTSILKLSLSGFSMEDAIGAKEGMLVVTIPNAVPMLIAGSPDLPKLTASLIIPDKDEMTCEVISSKYTDYTNIEIAPSKGSFSRKIDPSDVPYIYGADYNRNEFFPNKIADLNNPHILRDFRGETVNFYPIQYNPVSKTLRVYYEIMVRVKKAGKKGTNQLVRAGSSPASLDKEFNQIYAKHFINYPFISNSSSLKMLSPQYTPVTEEGSMLIISPNNFLTTMQPFVAWKKLKGIQTEIKDVATIGTTSATIKTYIKNYYTSHPSLKYVLLVGDDAQVPPSSSGGAPSDNKYGCIAGSDSYVEVFVGRFSGTTVAHIATQVDRTIKYEKNMNGTETYLNKGVGIASGSEPDDMNCIDGILSQMNAYTYSTTVKFSSGSGTQLVNKINQGKAGFVAHSGHGSVGSFGSISFSTTSCSSLTNTTMWPYMFCLACDVGIFTNGTCLAEAMVRAKSSSSGNPTGFVATQMAAISQPWYEPYDALNEQVAILTEQYATNTRWTFGGVAMNGCFKMLDNFPSTGPNVSDTWVIFGDPSLLVFTDNPTAMNISHANTISQGANSFTVNCDMQGALISLTVNGEIIGTAYSNGTSNNITISPALATIYTTMQVTVTAKNKIPYFGNVNISGTTSVVEKNSENGICIYPNPAAQSLTVNFSGIQKNIVAISVFDILGKKVLHLDNPNINNNTVNIDVSTLINGLYYLQVNNGDDYITNEITVFR